MLDVELGVKTCIRKSFQRGEGTIPWKEGPEAQLWGAFHSVDEAMSRFAGCVWIRSPNRPQLRGRHRHWNRHLHPELMFDFDGHSSEPVG